MIMQITVLMASACHRLSMPSPEEEEEEEES
jgi:hypothetical protein